jgi:hypothetical protein
MNSIIIEQPVFKICARQEWHDAIDCGFYKGSALDLADAAAISVKPIMLGEKGIPVITTDMLEVD